jgi:hypothetical protein
MEKIELFLDAFVNADTFLLFIVVMVIILFVLIMALFKTRNDIIELKNEKEIKKDNDVDNSILNDIIATSEEDKVDNNESLVREVKIPTIETYEDEIDKYEDSEEENAIISADELAKKKEERLKALGASNNEEAIRKYEEEQERKAIISYEQLVKNASNITLTYTEEEKTTKDAPTVNKIEVKEKEVTPAEDYINEEEFLRILKEFRVKLE